MVLSLTILGLLPGLLSAQIESGILTFVRIDSVGPFLNAPKRASDTVIALINGRESVYVVNDENKHLSYEQSRDTTIFYFTDEWVISYSKSRKSYGVCNLKTKISKNVVKTNGASYQAAGRFRMYEDYYRNTAPTAAVQSFEAKDTCSTGEFSKVERYHYNLIYTQANTKISQIDVCLTTDIQVPINLFLQYPQDLKACPVRYQKVNEGYFTTMNLITVETVKKEDLTQRIEQGLLQLLKD